MILEHSLSLLSYHLLTSVLCCLVQASLDQILVLSASKDNTAKLLDSETLDVIKTYRTERPVNSAAISPVKDHVSIM